MKKDKEQYLVDGFLFHDEALAQKAEREKEGIKYIKGKNSMENPEMVLQVYRKIIEQKLFETPVGIGYLRDLQEYLTTIPYVRNEDIEPIPIEDIIRQDFVAVKNEKKPETDNKHKVSLCLNVLLAIMVIAMFVIASTGSHPNILNYEEKLLDKYASWEEELKNREQEVRQKEAEMGITAQP